MALKKKLKLLKKHLVALTSKKLTVSEIKSEYKFLRNDSIKVSYERIGKVLGETAHCIWDQHQNFCRGERSDNQPSKLIKSELDIITDNIKKLHSDNNYPTYPTYADDSYYITQKFNNYINDDT